jgi:hypothetical protein
LARRWWRYSSFGDFVRCRWVVRRSRHRLCGTGRFTAWFMTPATAPERHLALPARPVELRLVLP